MWFLTTLTLVSPFASLDSKTKRGISSKLGLHRCILLHQGISHRYREQVVGSTWQLKPDEEGTTKTTTTIQSQVVPRKSFNEEGRSTTPMPTQRLSSNLQNPRTLPDSPSLPLCLHQHLPPSAFFSILPALSPWESG